MSDEFDLASDLEQAQRDISIAQSRKAIGPKSVGHCLYCNATLPDGQRWCDAWCREDWTLEQESRARHQGRR